MKKTKARIQRRKKATRKSNRLTSNQLIKQLRKDLLKSEKAANLSLAAGSIVHEINNPLNVISSQIEFLHLILENEPLDKTALINSLKSMEKVAERIKNIVQSVRNLSHKTQKNDVPVHSLNEVITSVTTLMNEELHRQEISLLQNHQNVDVQIKCGLVEVGQCLLNLFNNSIHAIRNQPEKWIKITSVVEPKYVQIHFTDCGKSLTKEIQKKLFTPYFTTKAFGQGTGLGLNISRQLLKSQGASLAYDSKNKNHVSFSLKLPRA